MPLDVGSTTVRAAAVATAGSAVVRYWVDKASSARTWTTPAAVSRRTTSNGSGGGSLSAITADTLGVAAGTAPAFTLVGIALGIVVGAVGFWLRVRSALRG